MPSTPPPYDSDAESAAIGCCLHNAEATRWATEWLCPADFYVPKWSTAFAAIVALYQEGQKADPVTVADRARRLGYENLLHADLLCAHANAPTVSGTSGVQRYGSIVRRHSVARAGLRIALDAADAFKDAANDPDEVVDSLVADLKSIDAHIPTGTPDGFLSFEALRVSKPESARAPWVIPGYFRVDWRTVLATPGDRRRWRSLGGRRAPARGHGRRGDRSAAPVTRCCSANNTSTRTVGASCARLNSLARNRCG